LFPQCEEGSGHDGQYVVFMIAVEDTPLKISPRMVKQIVGGCGSWVPGDAAEIDGLVTHNHPVDDRPPVGPVGKPVACDAQRVLPLLFETSASHTPHIRQGYVSASGPEHVRGDVARAPARKSLQVMSLP
jgi:hypothetical protein